MKYFHSLLHSTTLIDNFSYYLLFAITDVESVRWCSGQEMEWDYRGVSIFNPQSGTKKHWKLIY